MSGHAAFPGVGEQVLDREEPAEVDRRHLVPRSFDRRGRSLVERDLEGLSRIADEFHEGEIVHAATARDQEARVRDSGDELPRRRSIEDEDPVERLIGQ